MQRGERARERQRETAATERERKESERETYIFKIDVQNCFFSFIFQNKKRAYGELASQAHEPHNLVVLAAAILRLCLTGIVEVYGQSVFSVHSLACM